MQIELTFLRSKIARRIFGLFVISTLIPVGLLAFFSYEQINTLTNKSVHKHLKREAKGYGQALHDRLGLLENTLGQITFTSLQKKIEIDNPEHFPNYFTGLGLTKNFSNTSMVWGERFSSPLLSDLEIGFLNSGKTLLIHDPAVNSHAQIFMMRRIETTHSGSSVLIANINTLFLWGNKDELDLRLGLCIFNEAGFSLFCSKQNLEKAQAPILLQSNKTDRVSDDNPLFINSWDLFLKSRYFITNLTIVFSQEKKEALAPLNTFKTIFAGVIFFSLFAVAYISIYLIRRNTQPLESLMDGINRIANDNFNQPVPVTSHDEFGLLATSFNSMSNRISKQLKVLTTLAEIDRLILTRLKIGDILSIIMTRTSQIISSDRVSVALVNKDNNNLTTHTSGSKSQFEEGEEQRPISPEEIMELTVPWLSKTRNNTSPVYLQPLIKKEANYFLVLPIRVNNKLIAILSLGFIKKTVISDAEKTWVRDYADRIAVALSNASWEKAIYYQAHYDVLTALPNRQLLNDRLQQALLQAKREGFAVSVFFIDLDRFKSVNDSLGHTVGDDLLKEISQRIRKCIREGDTVARMGGDEFIVVLPNIEQGSSASTDVALVAKNLLNKIAKPITLKDHDLRISASIGIVMYPNDGTEINELIKNADAAMYHAKDKGKGNYQFYSEKLNTSALKRLLLESDLIGAVDRNEFELYYQPKVEANSGNIVGAEALIRWNHPTKGLVPPFEFIPIVEETSLIITIGHWVIRTACFQNKLWQQQGKKPILIAVNVAIKQLLHPGFVKSVDQALCDSKLAPHWLELEVTESSAMENMKETLVVLHELKALGVSLSIDDYGTGYSSLQYMKDFPADVLKIDQSFVFNLLNSAEDTAIVKSTIALAHIFGLKVIAEGVETKEHQQYLAELGCDELQGYFFSRPVPVDEFSLLLRNGNFEQLSDKIPA